VSSRYRGAAVLLATVLAGRVLDRFDLPFERRAAGLAAADTSAAAPPAAAAPAPPPPPPAPADSSAIHRTPRRAASRPRAPAAPAAPVALNRATPAELQTLPGVGPVLAERIVAFRAAHGPLRTIADLQRVQGIGARTAARLAPHVRFD
jgi:competence protein ComEA